MGAAASLSLRERDQLATARRRRRTGGGGCQVHNANNVPLYRKAGDTWLLSQDVAADLLDDGLRRRVGVQLLGLVLVVDIVADADELAAVVGAGQEDDSDTEDLGVGDALSIGSVGLEDELVDADGDGADEEGVELLVVLVRGGRADVGQLPLEICGRKQSARVASRAMDVPRRVVTAPYPSPAAPSTRR